jgi:GntR family transcriptional repressor for pyruvate dehydrogenase complex
MLARVQPSPADPGDPGARAARRPPAADLSRLGPLEVRSREPLASDVAGVILEQLAAGRLEPGARLPSERQLVEVLGVGRSTVREGLKALGLLGIVEFRHGGGTFVRSGASELLPRAVEWGMLLGERSIEELVVARRHVEVATAGLAAQRRSDDDLRELELALAAMAAATDVESFVDADVAFHLRVAEAAGNRVLGSMITSIGSLLRAWVRRVMEGEQTPERSADEHRAVLDAIVAGDEDAAAGAMRAHLLATSARLRSALQER